MCGICGFFYWGRPTEPGVLEAMVNTLLHRGPDGKGTYLDDRVGLGHTRLSIIDLTETGAQPIRNEDGSVLCVFNGEIYNYRELRRKLEEKGHVFPGTSDAEVIPHLYEEEGEKLFDKLRGMFAIAIYDVRRRRLLLGRDRFGIKPLYYAHLKDGVVFGSEIKAILADPTIPQRLNMQAIHDYLSLLYIPGPDTAFTDIKEVPPGQILIWEGPHLSERSFWTIDTQSQQSSPIKPELDRLGALLDKAVGSQLIADVPIGAMLSGGIDSSLVIESASRQFRSHGQCLPTFTVAFPDPAYDESRYAAEVARVCRLDHHILRLEKNGADVDLVRRVLLHLDQPFADTSAIPVYMVSREIRHHVKVALSGDGGDEMFGGYERFWRVPAIRRLRWLPEPLCHFLTTILTTTAPLSPDLSRQLIKAVRLGRLDSGKLVFALSAYLDEEQKESLYDLSEADSKNLQPTWRLFKNGIPSEETSNINALSAFITENLLRLSLPGDMLRKVDMMSMLAGLEVRVPLLDEELAEFALALPHACKVRGRVCKWVVRELAASRLSANIARKPKWGFSIPLDTWASPTFRAFLQDTLLGPTALISDFLNMETVSSWVSAFNGDAELRTSISRGGLYQRIYMLLSLELWLQKYKLTWSYS